MPTETEKKTRKEITDLLVRNAKTGPEPPKHQGHGRSGFHLTRDGGRRQVVRDDDARRHRAEPHLHYRFLPGAEREGGAQQGGEDSARRPLRRRDQPRPDRRGGRLRTHAPPAPRRGRARIREDQEGLAPAWRAGVQEQYAEHDRDGVRSAPRPADRSLERPRPCQARRRLRPRPAAEGQADGERAGLSRPLL